MAARLGRSTQEASYGAVLGDPLQVGIPRKAQYIDGTLILAASGITDPDTLNHRIENYVLS